MPATITTSVVTGGTNSHATTSAEVNTVATDFFSQGVLGPITATAGIAPTTGSFGVNAQGTPGMLVDVNLGTAYISATPTGQLAQKLRVNMTANSTSYTISSNSTGSTKYDWIYLKVDPTAAANPASDASDVTALFTSRSSSNTSDNGSPPTYGIPLATITVANGASSITNANIADTRQLATFRSSPNASAVNYVDVTSSATAVAPSLTAKGSDTNINLALTAKGNGLVKTSVLRNDNGTGTYELGNSVTLTGWAYVTPGVSSSATTTITFGVTFAQNPIVVATYGGDSLAGTTYGSGQIANKATMNMATYNITTTSFAARVQTFDGTSWSAGNTVWFQWIAIGEIT